MLALGPMGEGEEDQRERGSVSETKAKKWWTDRGLEVEPKPQICFLVVFFLLVCQVASSSQTRGKNKSDA